jgi:hypothetical protein
MYWSYQWQGECCGANSLSTQTCLGCLQTITISFANPVSNVTFTLFGLMNSDSNMNPALIATFVVQDNHGNSVTVPGYVSNNDPVQIYKANTVSLPWQNISQITVTPTGPSYNELLTWEFAIQDVTFGSSGILALDPVPDLVAGNAVTTANEILAQGGRPVNAIAADSAARLVLRIQASQPGEQFTLTATDDQGGWNSEDGYLATINGSPSGGSLSATAVSTSKGPIAFAQYFPPVNFARSGGQDDSAKQRPITIQAKSALTGATSTVPLKLLRPPWS